MPDANQIAVRYSIPCVFRIGFLRHEADTIQTGEQGRFKRILGPFYWLEMPLKWDDLKKNLKEAGRQIKFLEKIAQEQADLHFLALEYMKRRGVKAKDYHAWRSGKEAHKILVKEYERRAQQGEIGAGKTGKTRVATA